MLNEEQSKIEQNRLIGSIWVNVGEDLRILIGFKTMQAALNRASNQRMIRGVFLLNNGRIHHSIFSVDDLLHYENDHDQDDFRRVR